MKLSASRAIRRQGFLEFKEDGFDPDTGKLHNNQVNPDLMRATLATLTLILIVISTRCSFMAYLGFTA
jgi:hypothetical protein